jgi:hypothetical protein
MAGSEQGADDAGEPVDVLLLFGNEKKLHRSGPNPKSIFGRRRSAASVDQESLVRYSNISDGVSGGLT